MARVTARIKIMSDMNGSWFSIIIINLEEKEKWQ